MTEEPQQSDSSLGVSQNFAGALAYVLGWVSGFVILIVEKDSAYVRFHAVQSIVVFMPPWVTMTTSVAPVARAFAMTPAVTRSSGAWPTIG